MLINLKFLNAAYESVLFAESRQRYTHGLYLAFSGCDALCHELKRWHGLTLMRADNREEVEEQV